MPTTTVATARSSDVQDESDRTLSDTDSHLAASQHEGAAAAAPALRQMDPVSSATPQAPAAPPAFLRESERASLARAGCVGLTLPAHLEASIERFAAAAEEFFQLPLMEKAAWYPSRADNTEIGYHHVVGEKEYVTFRHATAAEGNARSLPGVERLLGALWHDVAHLLYRILCDIGCTLGIAHAAWLPLVERSLRLPQSREEMATTLLRIFRYEPHRGVSDPHADLGLLTLCIGRGRGLQVWDAGDAADTTATRTTSTPTSSAQWRDAPSVTLLAGDTLRVLSTNRVKAGRHQVIANPQGRASIVFALRPDMRTVIDLRAFGGEGSVHARALWNAIRHGRVNVNAQKDVRNEQRKQFRETTAAAAAVEPEIKNGGEDAVAGAERATEQETVDSGETQEARDTQNPCGSTA